jgi:hypothetical protein
MAKANLIKSKSPLLCSAPEAQDLVPLIQDFVDKIGADAFFANAATNPSPQ